MRLSREQVRHVALLARLGLEEGEEEFYAVQLSGILGHIDRLRELDTGAIPPTAQVVETRSVMREDDPRRGLSQDQALAGAPLREGPYFAVRAIQEAEP
ncbi:MAG: Asp-tRNA(Asn)/Glu-tRNA(Gln) amidotransferase subunit GatC [Candidatus Dormibacteraceae bacterium]